MKITAIQFAAEINRLATEDPTHVATCRYLSSGYHDEYISPVCIVGHAVINLVPVTEDAIHILRACEGDTSGTVLRQLGIDTIDNNTRHLVGWIRRVQAYQDNGETWADAVTKADRAFPEVQDLVRNYNEENK